MLDADAGSHLRYIPVVTGVGGEVSALSPACLAQRARELFQSKLTAAGSGPHGVTSSDPRWAGWMEFSSELSDLSRNTRYGSPLVAV
jgi:hypothetical protein